MPSLKTLLAAFLTLLLAATAATAQPVFPPGSRIGLVPPADMKMARGLTGFRNEATGGGILLVEMPPDAFAGIAASFTDQALKAQGFALRSRDKVTVGASDAILITGEQTEGGRRSIKSMLFTADASMTVLVMGQLPAAASPDDVAAVEKALRSVVFRQQLTLEEKIEALPFAISDPAGFRAVRAMAGNAILFTDGAKDTILAAEQPVLIVAQSFGPAPPAAQRESFARQGLVSNNFIKDAVLERSQGYRQGGADWHELVAKAKDALSGQDVIVVQTIRFEPDGYIRSVGIVRPDARDAILPRFRRVIDSVVTK